MEVFCKELKEKHPDKEQHEINDDALTMLKSDFLSIMDDAIDKGCYTFLKSLYPTGRPWWSSESDVVLLLAKAFGCEEWMSREEWERHCKDRDIDWGLYFRSTKTQNSEV